MLLAFLVTGNSSYGQKYKIKKDFICTDKEKVGRLSSEIEIPQDNFTISGLNGEKILTITKGEFRVSPYLDSIYWYNIRFDDTGKTMKVKFVNDCDLYCIVETVLDTNGLVIKGASIENQDEIIARYDISEEIKNDTTDILSIHNQAAALLRENGISRNNKQPVKLFVVSESKQEDTTTTVYSIAQDDFIIGSIVKRRCEKSGEIVVDYDIFKKLPVPVEGKETVPACKVTSTITELRLFTVVDCGKHRIELTDTYNAQIFLANYLVEKGYL